MFRGYISLSIIFTILSYYLQEDFEILFENFSLQRRNCIIFFPPESAKSAKIFLEEEDDDDDDDDAFER